MCFDVSTSSTVNKFRFILRHKIDYHSYSSVNWWARRERERENEQTYLEEVVGYEYKFTISMERDNLTTFFFVQFVFVSKMQQPMASRSEQQPNPVKYHYADTFWCIYITSVVSACIAELGTSRTAYFMFVELYCHNFLYSHLSTRSNENKTTNSRGGFNCKHK